MKELILESWYPDGDSKLTLYKDIKETILINIEMTSTSGEQNRIAEFVVKKRDKQKLIDFLKED